jgi:hypothetical protein
MNAQTHVLCYVLSLSASSLLTGVGAVGGVLTGGGGGPGGLATSSGKSPASAAETSVSRKHLPRLISLARKWSQFPQPHAPDQPPPKKKDPEFFLILI